MSQPALPIILARLTPEAKSWLISKSATERTDPDAVVRAVIETAAEKDGFGPPPSGPAHQTTHPKAA